MTGLTCLRTSVSSLSCVVHHSHPVFPVESLSRTHHSCCLMHSAEVHRHCGSSDIKSHNALAGNEMRKGKEMKRNENRMERKRKKGEDKKKRDDTKKEE